MNRNWFFRGVRIAAFAVVAVGVVGAVVRGLWNWLLPDLVGWHPIDFWQALGLLALTRILVGGLRGGGGRARWRARMIERWEQMSDEEREKFRAGIGRSCGRTAPAAPKAGAGG
jgi:hypothetical protein